jgi:metallo-beta-lactamase class B
MVTAQAGAQRHQSQQTRGDSAMKPRRSNVLIVATFFACAAVNAQDLPKNTPTKEQLAKDNRLFIELATKYLHWDEPSEPIHIVGPLYFVGTAGLSSWLFATPDGHVLLNTGTPKSGPLISASIRKLGFEP